MKIKLFLTVLLFCLTSSVFAKNSKLYSSGDLTCNLITDIIQDSRGFVWVATEYGLNKFDGMHFVQYLHNDRDKTSLGGNFVRCLFQDSKNNLWIGLSSGIQRYSPENDSFQTIYFDDGMTPFITKITEMSNGEIWITTGGRGVFVLNKEHNRLIRLNEISKISSSFIGSIYEDNKHQVWIGTDAKGVFCFDLKTRKFKKKYVGPDLTSSKITDIIQDYKGNLFIGNSTNVKVLDKKTNQFYPLI
jgi:ligand-binding sensor domain-containing protein